jgi:hypothetical protein
MTYWPVLLMLAGAGVLRTANAGVLEDFVDLQVGSFSSEASAPYMQRMTRLRAESDGTIAARRYTMPQAARFVGAWQQPARIAALKPGDLTELVGCDTVVTRAGAGRFEGTTVGNRCRNSYKGASYAISQSVLTLEEMVNWDRGFNAAGELVWGPAAGGYQFRRVDEAASPALPAPQSPR